MKVVTKNIYKRRRFWAGILLAQFVLFYICSKIPVIISLNESFFELQKKAHQSLFSWISISIGDVLYVISGCVLLYFLISFFFKRKRNKTSFQLLVVINFIYFIYQLFWGLLYFQKPLIYSLSKEKPTIEETQKLTLHFLELCKKSRTFVNENKDGVFILTNLSEIENEILTRQNQLPSFITKKGSKVNTIKPSLFKGIMSYSGILGYYNPFTAEAQYNSELPSTYIPFTLAHETAHQMGFAREQEANFVGYLAGKNSDNADLKYSTEYFALKSLLKSLVEKNPEFVKQILENYSPEMKRDREFEIHFAKKHEGVLDAFFGFTNNLFLKSNQQEGAVTYSYFVDLLVRHERIHR